MTRSGPRQHAPASVYRDAVELRLSARFGKTGEELLARSFIAAAQEAGLTPIECMAKLAELDGL